MMFALFAMIAFVTNLCSPMAVIVQNQFGVSELQSQIGNYANFIAYLVMGIPSGMLIVKFGYKKTALLAITVGIIGLILGDVLMVLIDPRINFGKKEGGR